MKKLQNILYWVGVPLIVFITTHYALENVSSPSTIRLIAGIITLIINAYIIFMYIKRLITTGFTNIFEEDKNA